MRGKQNSNKAAMRRMDGNLATKPLPAVEPVRPSASNLRERVQSLRLPDDVDENSRGWFFWFFAVLLLAAVVGGGYWAYAKFGPGRDEAKQPPAATSTKTEAKSLDSAPSVTAATTAKTPAVASSGEIALESKGYIIPSRQILISPQVAGKLTKLNIEEGQRVNKGDVLAEIESVEYDADLARAKAVAASAEQKLLELERGFRDEEKAQAEAELHESQAQRSQLLAEWQRIDKLFKSGVATKSEFDLAEANYKTVDRRVERLKQAYALMVIGPRVERIEAARADWALAKAELVKAQWRRDNCVIQAPVTGTILKKNAEEGNIVNPVAFNGSFSLCEMADLADLEVDLSIQERDVAKIFKGQKCKVRVEAYPDRVYEGYVDRLMPIADRAKGAVPVRVKVTVPAEEEGVYLKPEMGAIVTFLQART